MIPRKYHNYLPATNHKDIEIYDLSNKEFKTAVLRKFDKLQESTERQFRKKLGKQYTNKFSSLTKRWKSHTQKRLSSRRIW